MQMGLRKASNNIWFLWDTKSIHIHEGLYGVYRLAIDFKVDFIRNFNDFPSSLSFHEYSWICKLDNLHMRQLNEKPMFKPQFGTKFTSLE